MDPREIPSRVIDKIAKLLRLAGRRLTPEEQTAQKMADRLMSEWNIEIDLESIEAEQEDDGRETISFLVLHIHCLPWRWTLLEALAVIYPCNIQSTRDAKDEEPRYFLWIEGELAKVRAFRLHYNLLSSEIEFIVSRMGPTRKRHVYALGCARAIYTMVLERYPRPPAGPIVAPNSAVRGYDDDGFYQGPVGDVAEGEDPALPAAESVALAAIPRIRIRVEASAPSSATPRARLEVDLPSDFQEVGASRAKSSSSLRRWAFRVPEILNQPVGSIRRLPKRVCTALMSVGVRLVGELVGMRESQLLALPGIGPKTVAAVWAALRREGGLHLRPEDPFQDDVGATVCTSEESETP